MGTQRRWHKSQGRRKGEESGRAALEAEGRRHDRTVEMFSLLSGLAFLAGSFLLLKLGAFYWERSCLPPGPFPFPILGNLWQLSFRLHLATLLQLAETHSSAFSTWVGPTPVVVLSGFRAVKEVLISNSNGHTWWQQRRFCLTTLCGLGLGRLELLLQDEAAQLAEAFCQEQAVTCLPTSLKTQHQKVLSKHLAGRAFDPQVLVVRSTARVIRALVFGHRFLSAEPIFQELTQAVDFGLAFISTMWRQLYNLFPWALRHPGTPPELFRYQEAVRGFIRQKILQCKLRAPEAPTDFISCYLAQITKTMDYPVSTFNEENLIQVVIDLFQGGTDTTATTLRWVLVYMVQHGAVQERVQQELAAVLGTAATICYEDCKRLPFTRAVLHEVQHLSSVVAVGAVHQCVTSTCVHRYYVPKGTVILPNLASALCDPEHWETPCQFNPGHFLDKDGSFVVNEAFLPFSAGHRVCPGDQLARMELFLMFATLLRTFRFQLPEGTPGLRLEYVFRGTLQPQPQEIAVPRWSSCSPSPGPSVEGL
ncbi:LOW QUALITY PROTEIN: cytochrome P450 2B5-like [Erethizon dorsatum]